MQAERRTFLEAVFAGKPDDLHILLWTLPEKRSHWFRSVAEAARLAESASDVDLYEGVGLSATDNGPARRCVADAVAGIVGLWADIDLKSEAHSKLSLPATVEEALRVLPSEFPPTYIIATGNGLHAWWLFKEPLIFGDADERQHAANLVLRWQTLLRANAAKHAWAMDRLADLARVLRVPGTFNRKDPANPKPVDIHSRSDKRYNPSEFSELLDDYRIPDAAEQERLNGQWKARFTDKPLVLNLSVTVPQELLDRYMAEDAQFRPTWLRERRDLTDRTQSAYDLAIANFGRRRGLSQQHILDLMVHHRRMYGQRPRNGIDYFQRTIAKAFSPTGPAANGAYQAPEHNDDAPVPKPESAAARALLCDRISELLGVRVLRILKIAGKQPAYLMELDHTKIEFRSISNLIGQTRCREAIASATDHLIPKFKPSDWPKLTEMMLDALTIHDGGDEMDMVGSARIHIEKYLLDSAFVEWAPDQRTSANRGPTVIDGQIAICADDLQRYINTNGSENEPIRAVASMLTVLGAVTRRLKCARLRDQTRWLLPVDEFPSDLYLPAGEEKKPDV
jgi:hypothetical protein